MIRRARIVVTGTVQGVFFRRFTKLKAEELRLSGTVRNLRDGSVEVVCEGDEALIQEMIAWCRRGPDGAYVEDIDIKWEEPSKGTLKGFSIVYS